MTGQRSLNNFYQSVRFAYPQTADDMRDDVFHVALFAVGADQSAGQDAADRLRRHARDLPELHRRVLAMALTDLGYS